MTGKAISPLRQRVIEDITVRSFDPRTTLYPRGEEADGVSRPLARHSDVSIG